jgi:RNA polymerase sigma-70 factor (ECF subfamily)
MRFERERADPARVFALYADDVYRFCRASGCAAADAEDITAEVFAQALDQLAGLRWRRKPVSAFLYTLARRRVADHFRRRRRELPVAPGDVVERLAAHEDAHLGGPLRVALGNLADRERLAVIVRIVNGYSFAEVAVVLGSSEKAAKSLVYRALDKLEAALDAEGIER